jgi:hypothetical protein
MAKHTQEIERLQRAVAAIKTAGGPDDLPFLADEDLNLVQRLERRIEAAAARAVPARLRRAAKDAEDRRYRAWESALEAQSERAASMGSQGFYYGDGLDEAPVPFYLEEDFR